MLIEVYEIFVPSKPRLAELTYWDAVVEQPAAVLFAGNVVCAEVYSDTDVLHAAMAASGSV